jgi:hypothetical protein
MPSKILISGWVLHLGVFNNLFLMVLVRKRMAASIVT